MNIPRPQSTVACAQLLCMVAAHHAMNNKVTTGIVLAVTVIASSVLISGGYNMVSSAFSGLSAMKLGSLATGINQAFSVWLNGTAV